jgi:hypothetical protein
MSDAEAFLEQHKKFFQKIRIMTSCFKPGGSRSFLRILPVPKDTKEKAAFKQKYELIGIGNYKSMTTKTISEQILGVAIKEGLSIGADVMLFQEGAALIQTAKGWSIGFFNSLSTANVPDGTGYGNVVVGGLGFGRGESGYQSKPWLRVQFFRDLGVQPYVPMSQRQGAKQGKLDVNSYEESLQKPGKKITPEEAFQLKQGLPQPAK